MPGGRSDPGRGDSQGQGHEVRMSLETQEKEVDEVSSSQSLLAPRRSLDIGSKHVGICLLMQETGVQSLGREDPLEKEMATRSRILAWEIPWTEAPNGLQPIGSYKESDMT